MSLVWLISANLGLWTQAFKHKKWANILHLFFMGIVVIITWMSGFFAIIEFWSRGVFRSLHAGLGLTIMIIVLLQAILGLICWALQMISRVRPDIVHILNVIHRIFGWIILILTKI
jgi:hypothetical protein